MNDRRWRSEFRGLFYGEGHIGVTYYRKGGRLLFRPVIKITLREDDLELLQTLQQRLGGHLYRKGASAPRPHVTNPSVEWAVVQLAQIKEVHRILSDGVLPARKRRDIALFGEILKRLHKQGKKYTQAEKDHIYSLVTQLRESRRFPLESAGQVISA